MFENRALREMFVPKRYDVKGDTEDYLPRSRYDLYSLTDINRVIKSGRMGWTGRGM